MNFCSFGSGGRGAGLRIGPAIGMLAVTAAFGANAVAAGPTKKDSGSYAIVWENDLFGNKREDQNYSNGIRLSWLSPSESEPVTLAWLANILPMYNETQDVRYEHGLGQSIFTPRDLARVIPEMDDRSYAGLLYASFGLVAQSDNRVLDQTLITLGVVGPAAQAGEVQSAVHRGIGAQDPLGWDTQIPNQFAWELRHQRTHRLQLVSGDAGFGMELSPHYGLAVGSLNTFANIGAGFRAGWNLPNDFGPPRVSPSLPGSSYFEPTEDFGWYVFGGIDGRYVARNLVLDERNALDNKVDRETWVGDLQVGVAAYVGDVRVAYTHVWRSREFEQQESEFETFGAISLTIAN